MIKSYAISEKGGSFAAFEYNPGALKPTEVQVKVEYCGICHSDLSMADNEWRQTKYPLVPGHEAVGTINKVGSAVTHLKVGDRVGVSWIAGSCMTCHTCMDGDHNMCTTSEQTIVGRHGGFADEVRCDAAWAVPLPEALNPATAGPLYCGGITVFNPIVQYNIEPTHRVGVIGIGGLGHMAIKFLKAWGCEVTAFSSSEDKEAEAKSFGAHNFVNSRDKKALKSVEGGLDFVLSTVNVSLDWGRYLQALRPKGRLHMVGATLEPMAIPVFSLMGGQKSVSASPLGSPATMATMLDFAARHNIEPVTEEFPMSKVNDAMEKLRNGKPRYRLVLKNDF